MTRNSHILSTVFAAAGLLAAALLGGCGTGTTAAPTDTLRPTETPVPLTATPVPSGPPALELASAGAVLPEGILAAKWGAGGAAVTDIAWSPDGIRLAWPHENGVVIADVPTGLQVISIAGHTAPVLTVDWSPDGSRIATGSEDSTVRVWDVWTGEQIAAYEEHSAPVDRVRWSPDGQRLFSTASTAGQTAETLGGEVFVWDAASGEQLLALTDHTRPAAWLPDSTSLLTTVPGAMALTDVLTGEALPFAGTADWMADTYAPRWSGALSPDGVLYVRTLIQAHGTGSTAEAVSLETGEVMWSQEARYATIGLWEWAPDGRLLAMGGPNIVVMRDGMTGRQLVMLVAEVGDMTALRWSPDSQMVATGAADGSVIIWDASEY